MRGADFLAQFGGITDIVTRVLPDVVYPVRQATAHPIYEQARVDRFAGLLGELAANSAVATDLGQLMYESHASYTACGLGSDGTDRLVELVSAAGPDSGLFGAKITGGGSGGTVAILGAEAAEPLVRDIAARYSAETGRRAEVFAESGTGCRPTWRDHSTPNRVARACRRGASHPSSCAFLLRFPHMPAVGSNVPRKDGIGKATGRARYADDLTFPGMLHGRTIRSTIPRGTRA